MDLTKAIPTDSLYKFMAVGGLAVSFGCMYLFMTAVNSLNDRAAVVNMTARVFNARDKLIRDRIDSGDENAVAEIAALAVEEEKVRAEVEAISTLSNNTKAGMLFLTFAGCVAFVLSIIGFWLWWYKIQWYVDMEIKRRFESKPRSVFD